MIPTAIIAETKNRFREVMILGTLFLLLSLLCFGLAERSHHLSWVIIALFTFFIGFNMFEPIFPSLVTRLTPPQTKGTASGIYNFSQFLGHFLGAVTAGFFYKNSPWILLILIAGLELFFLYATLSFENPEKQTGSLEPASVRLEPSA